MWLDVLMYSDIFDNKMVNCKHCFPQMMWHSIYMCLLSVLKSSMEHQHTFSVRRVKWLKSSRIIFVCDKVGVTRALGSNEASWAETQCWCV